MNQTSIESTLAFDTLTEYLHKEGDICSYDALRASMEKDPQGDGYAFVLTARRRFEREMQCVLQVIPNVGIKRCKPREVINRGTFDMRHIRRSTKRAIQRQSTLVPVEKQQNLNNEERTAFLAQLSQFGVLSHMMKPSSTKKISHAAADASKVLASQEALALFRK